MSKPTPAAQSWVDAFRPACRRRGMRFVSGTAFVLDDVYITSIDAKVVHLDGSPDQLGITWSVKIKPLAVDEIFWRAFLPDVVMGAQMRINRRINGAFRVRPLTIAGESREVVGADSPDWDSVLDEFDRARSDFITAHPGVADFAALLQPEGSIPAVERDLVPRITALIAADRASDAARLADEAIARGESGLMSSKVSAYKYLSAYAKGPEGYRAFTASLAPTHNLQVLHDSQRGISRDLAREHHRGRISHYLASMDGSDPWAVVLNAHQPAASSALLYMQAAGTAEAMMLEFCCPGGDLSAGSVRSVVGRPCTDADLLEIETVLPHGTEKIARHEVFAADEAAKLFEVFYRTDTLALGYTLRPVERH